MTSNGTLASQRAAIIANLEDDLVAIRNLAIDVDEWADHPDSDPEFALGLLRALNANVLTILEAAGIGFAAKKTGQALDASVDRV